MRKTKINHFVFYIEMKLGLNLLDTDNKTHTPPASPLELRVSRLKI